MGSCVHSNLKAFPNAPLMSVPASVTAPAMCSILSPNYCSTLQTHFSTSSPVTFRPKFGWGRKSLMARRCVLKCMSALRYEIRQPVGGKRPMAKVVVNIFAYYCADDHSLQSSHLTNKSSRSAMIIMLQLKYRLHSRTKTSLDCTLTWIRNLLPLRVYLLSLIHI